MPNTETTENRASNPVAIRFYPEQRKALKVASRRTRISEQDLVRKLVDIHLPDLERLLESKSKAA